MTTRELATALGVTPQRVVAWRRQGMPGRGKGPNARYCRDAVAEWLVAEGHAAVEEPAPPALRYVSSMDEIAEHFQRHRRTIVNWRNEGMPVVQHGGGGRAGVYDLDAIEEWVARTGRLAEPETGSGSEFREQVEAEKLRKLRRENEVAERKLVSRAAVRGLLAERYAAARSYLERLTAQGLAALPADVDPAARARVRSVWLRLVDLSLRALAGESEAAEELLGGLDDDDDARLDV